MEWKRRQDAGGTYHVATISKRDRCGAPVTLYRIEQDDKVKGFAIYRDGKFLDSQKTLHEAKQLAEENAAAWRRV